MNDLDLQEITIKRLGDGWQVTRKRKENGESAKVSGLLEAFKFVAALYDNNGKMKNESRD
jgi:hypothetical protein